MKEIVDNPLNTASWTAFPLNWRGKPSSESGRSGRRPTALPSPGPLCSSAKLCLRRTTTPRPPLLPGGFSYRRQPLDILRSFLLFYLWSERCRRHFDDQYSLKRVLLQAWEATAKVGMASWKAIRSSSQSRDQNIQSCIEKAFKAEWLHGHIFGEGGSAISWHLLPPLYFLNFSNDWWGCCLPPCKGFTLKQCGSQVGPRSTSTHTTPWRMNGKWSGNSFPLSSSFLANYGS